MTKHNPLPITICKNCGKYFGAKAYHGRQKFCCLSCLREYQRKNTKRISLTCDNCGGEFQIYPSREKFGNPRFCCLKCANEFDYRRHMEVVPRVVYKCKRCGKEFSDRAKSTRKYCSQKCANVIFKISDPVYRRIHSPKWETVRARIILRDGGKCSICNSAYRLHVHHIVPWRISHDNSDGNLITLCPSCHIKVEWFELTCPEPTS